MDGEILWRDGEGKLQKAVVQVKGGGHVNDGMIRDLMATMEAEKASMALFVSLEPASAPMRNRTALAGEYELAGTTGRFAKVQLVTVGELLAGQRPRLPVTSQIEAHREARADPTPGRAEQDELDFGE